MYLLQFVFRYEYKHIFSGKMEHCKLCEIVSPDFVAQFPQWFINTFIIACFTCVISTMFVLMVAYAV